MKNLSQISVILMTHPSHFGHLRLAGMLGGPGNGGVTCNEQRAIMFFLSYRLNALE